MLCWFESHNCSQSRHTYLFIVFSRVLSCFPSFPVHPDSPGDWSRVRRRLPDGRRVRSGRRLGRGHVCGARRENRVSFAVCVACALQSAGWSTQSQSVQPISAANKMHFSLAEKTDRQISSWRYFTFFLFSRNTETIVCPHPPLLFTSFFLAYLSFLA